MSTTAQVGHGPAAAAFEQLLRELPADRISTEGPEHERTCALWNGAVTTRPSIVVHPQTVDEVVAAVGAARRHDLPLAVRAGGHDWAGRALSTGLVVDLRELREVQVDPDARTVTFGGGATATEVATEAARYGLAPVTGTVGSVGLAGLTLGGGYGPLSGRHGLAVDNVIAAEVVLADSRVVTTYEHVEPDLFWALRGGGGNFGVVTALTVRLHPLTHITAGVIMFPWQQAADVFAGLAEQQAAAPDELTVQSGVLTGPGGTPVAFVSPAWCGDEDEARPALDALHGLGAPLVTQVTRTPYLTMLAQFDDFLRQGRHYALGTRTVAAFTPDVSAAVIRAGDSMTSPYTGIALHHFHGVPTRVPPGSTAFGRRDPHLVIEMVAAWEPGEPEGCGDLDDGAPHHRWVADFCADLEGVALPGGYPNLLGPDETDRLADAYGANAERLLAVKRTYDPEGVFHAIGLPPGP